MYVYITVSPPSLGPAGQEQFDFLRVPPLRQAWHTAISIKCYHIDSALSIAPESTWYHGFCGCQHAASALSGLSQFYTPDPLSGPIYNWMSQPLFLTVRVPSSLSLMILLHVNHLTCHTVMCCPSLPVSWTCSLCVTSKQSHKDQPRSEVHNRKAETQGNRDLVSVSLRVPGTPTHRHTAPHSEAKAESCREC